MLVSSLLLAHAVVFSPVLCPNCGENFYIFIQATQIGTVPSQVLIFSVVFSVLESFLLCLKNVFDLAIFKRVAGEGRIYEI